MLTDAYWTQAHVAGITVIVGCLLFGSGAWLYWPIKDEKGSFIFGQPPHEWLRLLFAHPGVWRWGTILVVSGVVVALVGLALFTSAHSSF